MITPGLDGIPAPRVSNSVHQKQQEGNSPTDVLWSASSVSFSHGPSFLNYTVIHGMLPCGYADWEIVSTAKHVTCHHVSCVSPSYGHRSLHNSG